MRLITVIIAGSLFLTSCANKESNYVDFEHELDSYFGSYFKADEPGAAILIAKNFQTVYSKSFGVADLTTGEKITSKTLFNLGSISKTFVAYGILILEAEQELSLDDPLSNYFSGFKNKAIADAVTIKHLLTHTSGLPDIRNVREDSIFYLTARDEENWAPILQADSLEFAPGEFYAYSNPAFNALALIIEKVSGMKWQEFIEQRIFKPSGMTTSTITDGPHPSSGVSHGYAKVEGSWREDDYGEEPTFAAAGNGGVWSSVEELVRYEQAIAAGKFLDQQGIERSREKYYPANWRGETPPFIGLSWFIDGTAEDLKVVGHTGTQGGFYCHYVTIPEKQIVYIMLANRYYQREASYQKVIDLIRQHNWFDE